MGHIFSYNKSTERKTCFEGKDVAPVVKMAALAPKGVFEEEEIRVYSWEEEPRQRSYDDWDRNWDDVA